MLYNGSLRLMLRPVTAPCPPKGFLLTKHFFRKASCVCKRQCQTWLQLWRDTRANRSFSMRELSCAMTSGKGKTAPVAVNSLPWHKDLGYVQLFKSAGGWDVHQRGKPCAVPYRCMASYKMGVVMLPTPYTQYESSTTISWRCSVSQNMPLLFPEGSHHPLSSMPKPAPLHKCADVIVPACPTRSWVREALL